MDNIMKNEGEIFWGGHRDRLRERLRQGGIDALRPHEVLEILLGYVVPRVDMAEIARSLMDQFGTVSNVLLANRRQLTSVDGMNKRMADWLMLIGEIMEAYRDIDQREQFRVWRLRDIMNYVMPIWRFIPPPQVWVVFTGQDDCILSTIKLGDSLYISSTDYAREIMENALMLEAKFVYMIGFFGVEPLELSRQECEYLQELGRMLSAIDIRLMDYVLVGEAGICSVRQESDEDVLQFTDFDRYLRERYFREDDEEELDRYAGDCPLHEGEL